LKRLIIYSLIFFGSYAINAQDIQPGYTLVYYSGTIGESQKVEFNLQINEYDVTGSYIVEQSGEMYVFSGRLNLEKSGIGLLVYDQDNIYSASIEASLITESDDYGRYIIGLWKNSTGTERKDVNLKKVAEFAANEFGGLPQYTQLF